MDATTPSRPLILLVEDEAALASAVRVSLEPDYEVDVASNVEEALLLLASRRYAAIISDHMMPGDAQGLDFLVLARERQPAAKRILMSGYLNPEQLGRSMTLAELSGCLVKPVAMPVLRRELHLLLSS